LFVLQKKKQPGVKSSHKTVSQQMHENDE